jgi:serine/threonine protein kinase
MGTVFMAQQTEPVKRLVALKIIKPGMDSRLVAARFEAERQALALMDHPNIARVFDGGATKSGRPYFVMELVKGIPLTKYCDEHRLTPKDRLALFIPVCQAIQHAHQKGAIHRDIKPSNILVGLQIIDHDSDAVNSAEALIEARLLRLCRHSAFPLCDWPWCFPKLVADERSAKLPGPPANTLMSEKTKMAAPVSFSRLLCFLPSRLPNVFSIAVDVSIMVGVELFTHYDLCKIAFKGVCTSKGLLYSNRTFFVDIPVEVRVRLFDNREPF